MELQENILVTADQLENKIIEIRRDLHMHPEVSGKEKRTSSLVSEFLENLGIKVRRCKDNYGVIGLLRGGKSGPTERAIPIGMKIMSHLVTQFQPS